MLFTELPLELTDNNFISGAISVFIFAFFDLWVVVEEEDDDEDDDDVSSLLRSSNLFWMFETSLRRIDFSNPFSFF